MKTRNYKSVKKMLSTLLPDDKELPEDVRVAYDKELISNHLFIMRSKAGISQAEMAKRLGVTQGAVSKMENRADALSFHDVIRYSHALGYSVEMAFIRGGRSVDFLASYFGRITRMMDELRDLAGDDPDITKGIMSVFLTFSKSMLEDVIPQLRNKMPRRQVQLEISINPDEQEAPPQKARSKRQKQIA